MGCSTYLGLGWRYQPLAPGHPTSICDIGVKLNFNSPKGYTAVHNLKSEWEFKLSFLFTVYM